MYFTVHALIIVLQVISRVHGVIYPQSREIGDVYPSFNIAYPMVSGGEPTLPIREHDITYILAEYNLNYENRTQTISRLEQYAQLYPETAVFNILAGGESSLMNLPLYAYSHIQELSLHAALFHLFTVNFDFKRVMNVFRAQCALMQNDPTVALPRSVFACFVANASQFFSAYHAAKLDARNTKMFPLMYKLFVKLFEYAASFEIPREKSLFRFDLLIVKSFPSQFTALDQVDQFKILLDFVHSDDANALSSGIFLSTELVFYITTTGKSILHLACKWSRIEAVKFILELVHEIALCKLKNGPSAFAYAIELQNVDILSIFAQHVFNSQTTFILDSGQVTAIDFAYQMKFMTSYYYFLAQSAEMTIC